MAKRKLKIDPKMKLLAVLVAIALLIILIGISSTANFVAGSGIYFE